MVERTVRRFRADVQEGRRKDWRMARESSHRKSVYRRTSQLMALTIIALLCCLVAPASALDIEYCSTQNTGSDFNKVSNIYNSHGACKDVCIDKYAYAVVQGKSCWCSNYAPSTSDSSCTDNCPGYPDEKCGNAKESAYAYLALTLEPSGTIKATSKPTVSSTSIPTPTPPPTTTVTEEKEGSVETVTIVTTPKTTKDSTTDSATKSTDTSETTTPVISVITQVGGVQTVTYIPTSDTKSEEAIGETTSSSGSGISGGAIAGIVIGVVAAVLLIAGALLFYRHRKKKAAIDAESPSEKIGAGGAGVVGGEMKRRSRSLSTLGLVSTDKGSPASTGAGASADGTSASAPESAAPGATADVYDPRLDPGTLFGVGVMRYDRNTGSSRMSVRSLRDDADYSRRVLRLANPDDDAHT